MKNFCSNFLSFKTPLPIVRLPGCTRQLELGHTRANNVVVTQPSQPHPHQQPSQPRDTMKTPGLKATPGGTGGGDQSAQRQGPNSSHNQAGDSIILEEEIDPNYEPTEDEVIEYAKWLGMDLDADKELWWIAREGLKAPLPENWKPCKTTDTEEIYYFNFATGASTWDHPCDEYYRNLYEEEKKKLGNRHQTQEKKQKQQRERDDVKKLLGKDKKQRRNKRKKEKLANPLKGGQLNDIKMGAGKPNALSRKPLGSITSGGSLGSKPLGSDRNRDRDKRSRKNRDRSRSRSRSPSYDREDRNDRPTSSRSRAASRLSSALSDHDGGGGSRASSRGNSRDRDTPRESRDTTRSSRDKDRDSRDNRDSRDSRDSRDDGTIERRKREMENELRDIESEHERKLRRMESEHAADIRRQERKQDDGVRDQKDKHREMMDKVESELKEELLNVREQGRSDVRARKEKNEHELEDFQKDHQDGVNDLKKDHKRALERMERDHADEVNRRKRSHERTIEDEMMVLDKKFKDQKHKLERNAESEEKELTTALKRRLDNIQKEMEDKENKLLNDKRKDMERDVDKRMKEEMYDIQEKSRRARELAEKKLIKEQDETLEALKTKGRNDLKRSREIHVEEMTKLESRQKEEEHRMRKRLEEIRKRGSDAAEAALSESKLSQGGASSQSSQGGTAETIRLEAQVRKCEDDIRSKNDLNDTLRREKEQVEDTLKRTQYNLKETETDLNTALADKKKLAAVVKDTEQKVTDLEDERATLQKEMKQLSEDNTHKKDNDQEKNEAAAAQEQRRVLVRQHEDEVFAMKKKAKQDLATLEESMNVLRREEVEKAIEECQRTLRGEEQSSANERHVSEIQVLRDSIDVEKKKRIRVDDELIKQQKQLQAVDEEKKIVERKLEALEAQIAAEGKGAMGRVEQMKTFRKQVTDLEDQLKTIKAELNEEQETKRKTERVHEEDVNRLQRKIIDHEREVKNVESQLEEAEGLLSASKNALRESKELVRTNQRTHDNAMMVEMDEVNSKNELYVSELRSKHKQEKEELLLKIKIQKQYVDSGGGNTGGNTGGNDGALVEELEEAQRKVLSLTKNVERLDQELKTAMARAEEAENAVIESAGGSNASSANEYKLRSENKRLLSEIEDTASQLEVSKNENDVTLEKLRTLRTRINDMETTAKRAALDHEEMSDTIASLKRQHQHESDSYERRCTLLKKDVEALTASLKNSEKLNADLAFDVKSLTTAVEENRNNSSGTGGDNSELLLQVSRQRSKISTLERRETELDQALVQVKDTMTGKDERIRELRLEIAKQKKTIQKNEAAAANAAANNVAPSQYTAVPNSAAPTGSSNSSSKNNHQNPRSSSKTQAWQNKARAERELLGRAKKYVDSQKKEIRRRQRRIERDRKDWRKDMMKGKSNENAPPGQSRSRKQMLKEIKKSLEHDSNELNAAIAHLRTMDVWLKEREKKVVKLEAAAFNGGANGGEMFDESFDFSQNNMGGSASSSDASIDAARLSEELDDDFSFMDMSMSGNDGGDGDRDYSGHQGRGGNPHMWQQHMYGSGGGSRRPKRRQRQSTSNQPPQFWSDPSSGFDPANQMYVAAAAAAAAAIQQHQQQNYNGNNNNRNNGWMQQQHYADENVQSNMERKWMARGRPTGDRVSSATGVTHPDVGHRLGVFQSQMSRWSGKQQTARDAMTRHASWLRKFGQEIQTTRNAQNKQSGNRRASFKTMPRSSEIAAAALNTKDGEDGGADQFSRDL